MRPTTLKLIIYIFITIWFCSCSPGKAITGEIRDISGKVVECKGKRFLLLKSAPMPLKEQVCTFTPTVNRKKINAKRIN